MTYSHHQYTDEEYYEDIDNIAKDTAAGVTTGAAAGALTGGLVALTVGKIGIAALGTAVGVGAAPVVLGATVVGAVGLGAGALVSSIRNTRRKNRRR